MPSYNYRCQDCKRRFEVYLSYDEYDKQEVHCTNCNSLSVQRQIGRIRIAHSEEHDDDQTCPNFYRRT